MKKIILSLCLVMMTWIVVAQGIRFEKGTFAGALEKARKENKMVFVDVYAVWCGPCKWMSNTVFLDPEIGKYTDEHFVSIKIDSERGEGPSVKTRYAVEGLPGYLFLDSEGNVVYRKEGSMPAEKFMAVLKQAREYAADPNSVGRIAARYEAEKNNEQFLRTYLDKLKTSGSAGYYDVVEQYLGIQKTMAESSGEMVNFLYDHTHCLIFGGESDRILKENIGSEVWDLYVRKKVRETFQRLPETMARQTTEYAILKRDTVWIDLSLRRLAEEGVKIPEGQKERLLIYFYRQTEQGEPYKKLVAPQIEAFYNSLNVEELKAAHQRVLVQIKAQPNRIIRSWAMINSEKLRYQAAEYARFVLTPDEQVQFLKWAARTYEILPADYQNVAFYAKALYLNGDRNKAFGLMEEAIRLGANEKHAAGLVKDYETMKNGGKVTL
ncbi:MAG: thioredoxin family protein [Odoribacter sp.]